MVLRPSATPFGRTCSRPYAVVPHFPPSKAATGRPMRFCASARSRRVPCCLALSFACSHTTCLAAWARCGCRTTTRTWRVQQRVVDRQHPAVPDRAQVSIRHFHSAPAPIRRARCAAASLGGPRPRALSTTAWPTIAVPRRTAQHLCPEEATAPARLLLRGRSSGFVESADGRGRAKRRLGHSGRMDRAAVHVGSTGRPGRGRWRTTGEGTTAHTAQHCAVTGRPWRFVA
jgi:hypothetical protein